MAVVLTENEKISLTASAQKLLFLVHSSSMPTDVKDAWITLLPDMSLEQIDKLSEVLEWNYLDAQTKDIDEEYLKKIKEIS